MRLVIMTRTKRDALALLLLAPVIPSTTLPGFLGTMCELAIAKGNLLSQFPFLNRQLTVALSSTVDDLTGALLGGSFVR